MGVLFSRSFILRSSRLHSWTKKYLSVWVSLTKADNQFRKKYWPCPLFAGVQEKGSEPDLSQNISKCSLEVSHIREEKGSICVAPQSYTIALPPLTKLKETGENTELHQYWALCLAWDYLSLLYFRNNCFSSHFLDFYVGFFLIRHNFAFPWNPSLSLIVPLTPNVTCICIYCIYKELKHFLLLISFLAWCL